MQIGHELTERKCLGNRGPDGDGNRAIHTSGPGKHGPTVMQSKTKTTCLWGVKRVLSMVIFSTGVTRHGLAAACTPIHRPHAVHIDADALWKSSQTQMENVTSFFSPSMKRCMPQTIVVKTTACMNKTTVR